MTANSGLYHDAGDVLARLRGAIPGARATLLTETALPRMGMVREMWLKHATLPIRTDQAEAFAASLLHALGLVEPGETLVLQAVAFPVVLPTSSRPRFLKRVAGNGLAHGPEDPHLKTPAKTNRLDFCDLIGQKHWKRNVKN